MNCSHCRNPLSRTDAVFCPRCGQRFMTRAVADTAPDLSIDEGVVAAEIILLLRAYAEAAGAAKRLAQTRRQIECCRRDVVQRGDDPGTRLLDRAITEAAEYERELRARSNKCQSLLARFQPDLVDVVRRRMLDCALLDAAASAVLNDPIDLKQTPASNLLAVDPDPR